MELMHPQCAGLDVHQHTGVACARVVAGSSVTHDVRSFGTTTQELLALSDWLTAHGCTHVAMESTGVYWKPVWHVLEGHVELVLANAMHIRNIPGRKSDVNDATWIADLLAHGLLRGSFVPPPRSRNCAISPGPASSSCARSRNTPSGSRRPWRPRTSS
jgi:transposase